MPCQGCHDRDTAPVLWAHADVTINWESACGILRCEYVVMFLMLFRAPPCANHRFMLHYLPMFQKEKKFLFVFARASRPFCRRRDGFLCHRLAVESGAFLMMKNSFDNKYKLIDDSEQYMNDMVHCGAPSRGAPPIAGVLQCNKNFLRAA